MGHKNPHKRLVLKHKSSVFCFFYINALTNMQKVNINDASDFPSAPINNKKGGTCR